MRTALFVVPVDGPGGAERVMAAAAAELVSRGDWQVRIISLAAQVDISFLDRIHERVRVDYGHGGGGFPSEWSALHRVARQEFDIVFGSHFRINAALAVGRRLGVLRTARLITRESTVLTDRSTGARLKAYRGLYSLYGAQDEIWAQTTYMAERLREVLPARARAKVGVIPNPVDAGLIRSRAAELLSPTLAAQLARRPHIAWCGRFIDIKAPHLALDALAELRARSGQDVGLLMIGAGPLVEDVRRAAEAKGLDQALVLAGHSANPYSLMSACQAGLLTSKREGFPNVLLEMMALGLPTVVSTPCAGDLDSLEGLHVVGAHTAAALGEALAAEFAAHRSNKRAYEQALQPRTPKAFVDRLLGITASG